MTTRTNMALQRLLDHAAYLEVFRAEIGASHLKALLGGATDPAVLLLDLQDESAQAIVETTGRGDEVTAQIAEARRHGCSAVVTWGIPRTLAVALLVDLFPAVADKLSIPFAEGAYWVAIVAGGSASAAMIPRADRDG